MIAPSPLEVLTAPWSAVSVVSKIILALQIFWAVAGLVPRVRHRVGRAPLFMAVMIGPPLLWVLMGASFELLSWGSVWRYDFHTFLLIRWLLLAPSIIGTTFILQAILALEYAAESQHALPLVGAFIGLLAIGADAVLFLWLTATF